jgi:hypothetical protein
LLLTFGSALPAGGKLYYGYGYGRLAGPDGSGRDHAIYDNEGMPIHVDAHGLAVTGSGVVSNGFDTNFYKTLYFDVANAGVDPAGHYETYGWRENRDPNSYFDTNFYLTNNPDVRAANINPLTHYMQYGAREGRDPSSHFDTSAYLSQYTDVAAAGVNPLQHFLQWGVAEGRSGFGDLF